MTARPRARHRAEGPARRGRTRRARRPGVRALRAPLLLALVLTTSVLTITAPSEGADDAVVHVPATTAETVGG